MHSVFVCIMLYSDRSWERFRLPVVYVKTGSFESNDGTTVAKKIADADANVFSVFFLHKTLQNNSSEN